MTAYASEKHVMAMLAMIRTRRVPARSENVPVIGAEKADAYVRNPRNSPAAVVPPPSARIRNGAVGSSWKAERKTVNENPHKTKKRGVNRRLDNKRILTRRERASTAGEPRERSEPAKRRARERAGESEGQSPSGEE